MDTIGHGVQSGAIVWLLGLIWRKIKPYLSHIIIISAFFGILPDIIGWYGKFILKTGWVVYNSAHFGEIYHYLKYFPTYWLHCYLDSIMHGSNAWWVLGTLGFYMEVVMWLVNAGMVYVIVRIIKHQKQHQNGTTG